MRTSHQNPARRRHAVRSLLSSACGDDGSAGSDSSTTDHNREPVIDPGDGGELRARHRSGGLRRRRRQPVHAAARSAPAGSTRATSEDETERVEVVVTDERKEIMGDLGHRRAGHRLRRRRAGRGHLRLVRPGPRGQRLVPRRGRPRTTRTARWSSTEGSWEAGVDGALPGIVMPADPQVGDAYRQEYYPGEAEDMVEVLRWASRVTVAPAVVRGRARHRGLEPARARGDRGEVLRPGVGKSSRSSRRRRRAQVELVEFTQLGLTGAVR